MIYIISKILKSILCNNDIVKFKYRIIMVKTNFALNLKDSMWLKQKEEETNK